VSQLKTHELNPLHWIIQKVLKIKSPGSAATEFGGRFHEEVEAYLKRLVVLDENIEPTMPEVAEFIEEWFAVDGLALFEKDIEHEFNNLYIDDKKELPPFMGVIDVLERKPLRVIDHKTVGNKKFCLKQKDLKEDDQLILYAYYALTQIDTEASEVIVQHNQYFKNEKKTKFKLIKDTLSREYVMERIELLREKARKVVDTYNAYKEKGLEAVENRSSDCRYAFGGCPYWPICSGEMSPEEFKKLKKEGKSNTEIQDKLNEKKLAKYFYTFTNKSNICYNKNIRKKEDKKEEIILDNVCGGCKYKSRVDLIPLIQEASGFCEDIKNQFEVRKEIAKKVCELVIARGIRSVVVPLFLITGSDPDITPTLTALKKNKIELIYIIH
jgi:hypothetical protein